MFTIIYKGKGCLRTNFEAASSFNRNYALGKRYGFFNCSIFPNKPSNQLRRFMATDILKTVLAACLATQLPNAKHWTLKVDKVAWVLV